MCKSDEILPKRYLIIRGDKIMKKKSKKNIKMVKKYTHTVDQQCPLCGKISFMRL